MILYKQFNFGLASQTFGLVTSSNSLPEGQPHLFIFVSPCGVGIFHAKNRLEYFPFLCFAVKEKFFELFGDHIFHLVTMKIFQLPVGICLIKVISDFVPCVA